MNGDDTFAKNISTQIFHLQNQLLKYNALQQSFIIMACELLQDKMPFPDHKDFEKWNEMMMRLQE